MAEYKPFTHEGSQGYYDSESGDFLPVEAGWKTLTHEGESGLYNSNTGEFFPAKVATPGLKGFAMDVAKQVPLAGMKAAETLNAGMGGIYGTLESALNPVEDVVHNALGLTAEQTNQAPSAAELFRRGRTDHEAAADFWKAKQDAMGGTTDPVTNFAGQLVGGALPGALGFAAGVPYGAVEGAVEASQEDRNPLVGAAVGAGKRALLGGIFKGLAPYSRPIRMGGMAATTGTEAAAEGEPVVPAIGAGLAMGAMGGKGKVTVPEAVYNFGESITPKTYQNYTGPATVDPLFYKKAGDPKNIQFWEARRQSKAEIAEAKREYNIAKEAENINLALDKSRELPESKLAPNTQLQIEAAIKANDFKLVDQLRPYAEQEMEQRLQEIAEKNRMQAGESITPEENYTFTKLAMESQRLAQPIFPGQKKTLPIEEGPVKVLPEPELGIPHTAESWKAQQPPPEPKEFDFLKTNPYAKEGRDASPQDIRKNGKLRNIWEKLVNFVEPGTGLKSRDAWLVARGKARGKGVDAAVDFVDLLNKRFGKEAKSDLRAVFDSINGWIPYNGLTSHQKYLSNRIRWIDDYMGRQLVEQGLISKQTYYNLQGKHLRFIHDIYNYEPGLRGAKINSAAYRTRKDISTEERLARGFNQDPLKSISLSVLEGKKNVEMSKYFTTLSNNPEIVYQNSLVKIGGRKMGLDAAKEELNLYNELDARTMTPEMLARKQEIETVIKNNEAANAKPSSDFLQLKGKRYGDLNGTYIQKDVYHDIVPILDFSQKTAHTGLDMMREWSIVANSLWKTKTVALNAPTILRNLIFSNPIQMNMSGVPVEKVPVYFGKAMKSLAAKDWQYTSLRDRGAFATNWTMGDIADLAEMVRSTGRANHPVEKLINLMTWSGKLYGKVDDVWKLAKFIEQTEKGKTPDTAFLEAQKWVMDYSLMDKTIRATRAYPLGAPFIVYQYKILPLLLETMRDRPWVFAKYALIPAAMQAYAMRDATPEQIDEFNKNMPQNLRDGQTTVLPIKVTDPETGKEILQSLDMSPLTPWGNIYTMLNYLKEGKYTEAAKTTGALSGLAPQLGIGLVMNRDPYTGREIVSPFEAGDPKLAAIARLNWMNKLVSPGMVTDMGALGKISEWMEFAKSKRGMPLSWYNAVPRLAGVNINPIDPRAGNTEFAGKAKQIQKAFTSDYIKMQQQGNEEGRFGGLLPGKEYYKESLRDQIQKLKGEYKGE